MTRSGRRIGSRRGAAAWAWPLLLMLLGGCADNPITGDPFQQPGTWHTTGDNDANLRAMVADPRDLVAGKDAANGLAVEAVPPVGLLFSGKRQALSGGGSMSGAGGSQSGGSSQGGGSAGAQ